MKPINLFSFICLVLSFCDFTEKKNILFRISLIKTRPFSRGDLNNGKIDPDIYDTDISEKLLYDIDESIDSELSEENEEEDQLIFIDDMERSNLDLPISESGNISSGDEMEGNKEDTQNNVQTEGELMIDAEGETLGFNPKLYFNSHKCFLMIGFEIEFLENPVLNNSGIIRYIKETEINIEEEVNDQVENSEDEKYKLIELETKNKKQEEITSLMRQIRNSCWYITSESTLQEFKDEVLSIIEIIESKICQINAKLEYYIMVTDQKSLEFDSTKYERNLEKKSRLLGRKSSYELALSSFRRIEEYWSHLENLPYND
ncbi:uncharacterized protein cubi_01674 [Cryptosporidium ubiquitum]|uniref:Signal peptide-containing protein n=1 Tax=Cryptosporidium ubiquitum TaxID=857276 RepID=A0A1J4MI70_9CRYT|nr:uncharacterized protein cubi_01674 [Cryptosporidium ubiquitum]OII72724.1 hypothetical protein cubi_01674 [Cryptosporidium ubiquitum]